MKAVKLELQGSGRHVHLSENDFKSLFGNDAQLHVKRDMGAGMFQAEEKIALIGPKGSFKAVSILGPFREKTQVEISLTDARTMGVNPPIRMSGDLSNSESCILKGPLGTIEIKEGVIVAKRHIHFTPQDAEAIEIQNGDNVLIFAESEDRKLIFDDVIARVDDQNDVSEAHIDIDEINAAHLPQFSEAWVFNRNVVDWDLIEKAKK